MDGGKRVKPLSKQPFLLKIEKKKKNFDQGIKMNTPLKMSYYM